eukprot:Skav216803  [mRNA]  locus=scaffold2110:93495:99509:- [translate_table: standard]
MEPSDALDVKDLEKVLGVKEFHIAKVLLEGRHKEHWGEGRAERVGDRVPSQWGPVTIFDLCAWFGLYDTTLALADHGVGGCTVEEHHFGPYAEYSKEDLVRCADMCACGYCCFGWPVDKGIWMQDWDVPFEDAVEAAERAAERCLCSILLEMIHSGEELPFNFSTDAMARLLDIAILIGDEESCAMILDAAFAWLREWQYVCRRKPTLLLSAVETDSDETQEAAAYLSRNCPAGPLRRWTGTDLFESVTKDFAKYSKVLIAALQAGADFEGVQGSSVFGKNLVYGWERRDVEMPLRVALFLQLEISQWQQLEEFFPPSQEKWRPPKSIPNNLARHFFCQAGSSLKLCINKIRSAERAALDIGCVGAEVSARARHRSSAYHYTNLLGIAILLGQLDSAIASVRQDMEATSLAYDPDGLWNFVCVKRHLDDGIWEGGVAVICVGLQVKVATASECRSAACAAGRAVVRHHAAEKLVVIYQVLRKMFRGRRVPMEVVHSIVTFSVRVPRFVDELGLSDLVEGTPFGDATAEHKSTDELLRVLQASRDQVPALNVDGVCVFRLTRGAKLPHVNENLMKALFVPLTEAQMVELQALKKAGPEVAVHGEVPQEDVDEDEETWHGPT